MPPRQTADAATCGPYALDAKGRQTTDPNVALDGGTVQPIGGPKGSALAMLMDVMGGVISGAAFGGEVCNHFKEYDKPQNVGHFIMAMKPICSSVATNMASAWIRWCSACMPARP